MGCGTSRGLHSHPQGRGGAATPRLPGRHVSQPTASSHHLIGSQVDHLSNPLVSLATALSTGSWVASGVVKPAGEARRRLAAMRFTGSSPPTSAISSSWLNFWTSWTNTRSVNSPYSLAMFSRRAGVRGMISSLSTPHRVLAEHSAKSQSLPTSFFCLRDRLQRMLIHFTRLTASSQARSLSAKKSMPSSLKFSGISRSQRRR